jgi:hypothetical protein
MGKRRLWGLTLHMPWAWCCYALPPGERKDVENRDWLPEPALVGDYLALHNGQTWDEEAWRGLREVGYPVPPLADHPAGAIVAVARLAGLVTGPDASSWRTDTKHALRLADTVTLAEPVRTPGNKGLWLVRGALLEQVRAQWARGGGRHG